MAERIKHSFGKIHVNQGKETIVPEERYQIDYSRKFYLFDVVPIGAVRMTKSDTWKLNPNHPNPKLRQRKAVQKYFTFKTLITLQANQMRYVLGQTLDIVFLLPMPSSWSDKKKEAMNGMPCKVKPDIDNLVKSLDCLNRQDQEIWILKAQKYWAYKGSIIIYG